MEAAYPRLNEVPFDSERKRMSTILDVAAPTRQDPSPFDEDSEDAGQLFVISTKGAMDQVLPRCTHYQRMDDTALPMTDELRARITAANETMARDALRVLAVAYRTSDAQPAQMTPDNVERDLVFLGLFGMIDPPRLEVPPQVERARKAGIRTIMITGDYPDTAAAIGRAIGLLRPGRQVLAGSELRKLDDAALAKALDNTDVFARVDPQHKMRIVEALRQKGQVVAMTGDGVNDAPALKRADIGIAMGITGTDVAKETADMVLTDDNYASIVAAVEQGRIIYANIRKFVFFLLSSNVAEIMIIFIPTLLGLPTPLTAIQLLWLNLVTDGAPALALALEKGDPDVMDHPPRPKTQPVIHGPMRLGITIQTVMQTVAVLGAFAVGLAWHLGHSPLAPGNAPGGAAGLQLARGGRAERRNDGLRHPVAGRAVPGLHGALGAAVDLHAGLFLQPLPAGRGGAVAGPAAGGDLRAVPAADLQHPRAERAGVGSGAGAGGAAGGGRGNHQVVFTKEVSGNW